MRRGSRSRSRSRRSGTAPSRSRRRGRSVGGVIVGVVANPASGRDIRRLVAGASVFGNADKAGMVLRLLTGLGAAGVERVLMMPASDGLSVTLARLLRSRDGAGELPDLEVLDMPLTGTADDSVAAVERMLAAGVAAIV